MEPKFQSSFIPKRPIITMQGSKLAPVHDFNIFSIGATVIFLATFLFSGGLFIYKNIVVSQIVQADQDLNAARDAFQAQKIQDLIDANARIMATKSLLQKHVVVSELLVLLNNLTVKRMRLTDFTYTHKGGGPTVSMSGEGQTYNALAEQGDIFAKNEFIKNQTFSDFQLAENGNIKVKFFADIDPTLVSYKNAVQSISLNQ